MNKFIDNYIVYLEKELNYSNETIKSYKFDITEFSNYIIEKKLNYLKIQKTDIRNYLKMLHTKKLSNKSISRKLSSLRMFYNYLCDEKVLNQNSFNFISNPKVTKKLPNYLNYEETENLLNGISLDNIYGIRNRLILEIIYSTGIRLNEAVNIKLNDINYEDKVIKIFGKGSKDRFVVFGEYTLKYLKIYLKEARNLLLKKNHSDYLFVNKFGNQLSKSMIEKIVKNSAKEISLKHNISPHTLRHTFATHMLNNGADIKTVQELLGHESLGTTEIYTHVSNDRIKDVYLKTHPREVKNGK